jgi:[ribosomal protein S5]-alanine N-acetyltransferase
MWLETQRLVLREFQREDFRELAPILADPQVMKFSPTGVLAIAQTQGKIENFITSYQKFGFGKWAVICKERDRLIGYCGIAVEQIDNQEEKEIGYRLDSRFWGKGLATEAAAAAIQYGFEQFKFAFILGIVERANTASVRVLEKLGMQYERETIFHGANMDVYRVDADIAF